MKSWKTTVAGILTDLIAVGSAAVAELNDQSVDWTATIAAVSAAFGLLFAKDSNK